MRSIKEKYQHSDAFDGANDVILWLVDRSGIYQRSGGTTVPFLAFRMD